MRLSLLWLAAALWLALAAQTTLAQPDALTLAPALEGPQHRPSVKFPHAAHQQNQDCTACHHYYDNGRNAWTADKPTTCADCHKSGGQSKLGLQSAFHRQCLGCHTQLARAKQNSGPRTCGACHVRPLAKGQ